MNRVELDVDWIVSNFGQIFADQLKEHPRMQKTYLQVPAGDAHTITLTENISNNPFVEYQQGNQNSCAFDALSSALSHLSFFQEAESLNCFKKKFDQSQSHWTMECIVDWLSNDDSFSSF